jgi:predicted amidohydrolase YtcJ
MLIAKPSALILYSTLAQGPRLPPEDQINSTRHFMRELNRLGITSVIDAGGGGQAYPQDYDVIQRLHDANQLTVRIAYNLFAQKAGEELTDYQRWIAMTEPGAGSAFFQGEYFVDRYGADAARLTPPIARMLAMDVPVGAGTDATRVASFDPWVSLFWMTTGKTVGGRPLYGEDNVLDRETALRLWTHGSAWFSGEHDVKGTLAPGRYADLAILSADYMTVPPQEIRRISAVMTMVGGKVVHGEGAFAGLAPPLPPASPSWTPVAAFASPGMRTPAAGAPLAHARSCHDGCGSACGIHGHDHHIAWNNPIPARDLKSFWGAVGCTCFAV